jgi:hypothetical protein
MLFGIAAQGISIRLPRPFIFVFMPDRCAVARFVDVYRVACDTITKISEIGQSRLSDRGVVER